MIFQLKINVVFSSIKIIKIFGCFKILKLFPSLLYYCYYVGVI